MASLPPSVRIDLSPGLQRLLRDGPAALVHPAIARAMDYENELTVGAAVRDRMSFPRTASPTPEGLRVQSGRLRRSLHRSRARIVPDGVLSAIGSNVRYFGPHEFGFDGRVQVRAHTRKTADRVLVPGGRAVSARVARAAGILTRRGTVRPGFGELLEGGVVQVRAHEREQHTPARRMVQRTVLSRVPNYQASIAREVTRALSGGTPT